MLLAKRVAQRTFAAKLVLDVDRLGVEVLFDALAATLAAPTGLLVAADRHRGVRRDCTVHPDLAGAKLVRHADVYKRQSVTDILSSPFPIPVSRPATS